MKFCASLFLLFLFSQRLLSQDTIKDKLKELNTKIVQSEMYDSRKFRKIDQLYHLFEKTNQKEKQFDLLLNLYNEYAYFNFDSAYKCAIALKRISNELNEPSRGTYATMKLGFILLSSGMFKEALDSLQNLNLRHLNKRETAEYYALMARCYYDMSDYNNDRVFSPKYDTAAARYIDSSLQLFETNSFENYYYHGLQQLRLGNDNKAAVYFDQITNNPSLSPHEIALLTSTFADVYIRQGKTEKVIDLLIKAATADIESATKETSALFNLANLFYENGDIENASVYLKKASADAKFYGARQRIVKINSILPLIEKEKLTASENEKKNLVTYAFIVTFFLALLLGLTTIIFRQIKKLSLQQLLINSKNDSLQHLLEEKEVLLADKEWLLKEVQHRVKNNLHTVLSLLESQAVYLEEEALVAIRDCQHRIHSMALLHQKLYQSENLSAIEMSVYLPELVNYLSDSFDTKQRIRFHLQIEPIELDVSLAVPLGLILNEAITNCIKYAFKDPGNNKITISMNTLKDNDMMLTVSDNGVGLAPGFEFASSDSLGIRLMKGLTEDIGGGFKIEDSAGCKITILFSIDNSSHTTQKSNLHQ